MEKVQRQRSEMIQHLQGIMEDRFQSTCSEVQSELDSDACRIWRGFDGVVQECLEAAGTLQQQGKKGRLGYLAFGLMQHTPYFGKLELRIDALDDGFYLDMQEASAHYQADFLQDRYRRDLEYLYRKARDRFVRIQNHELIQIRQEYAGYYYTLLFHMVEALTDLIAETVIKSGIDAAKDFRIICGEYMDKAVVLYGRETEDGILSHRD